MKPKKIKDGTDAWEWRMSAHRYCALMGEAIYSLVQSYRMKQRATQLERGGDDSSTGYSMMSESEIFARYAFLLASNALENCAFSLLANSKKLSSPLLEDIDKLSTLNKFELFSLIHGKEVIRGDDRYAKVKEVIKCRNAFVHPKCIMVPMKRNPDRPIPKVVGTREYPLAFEFVEVEQVALMIGDILRFIAWVVFDICGFSLAEGEQLISDGSKWWINSFDFAEQTWKYDLRSFGETRGVKVKNVEVNLKRAAKKETSRA